MLQPRKKLVVVPPEILSSYPVGAKRIDLKPLSTLPMGRAPVDVVEALAELHTAVLSQLGDFRVTDLYRDYQTQAAARLKYETWLAAGKPTKYDPATMKPVFVAEPGYSFHNAGRAIDLDLAPAVVYLLNEKPVRGVFTGIQSSKQLDKLWEVAKPLGWRPAIKTPTEGAAESWHFDFMGEWSYYFDRSGDYKATAMCACLDIGVGTYGRDEARALQAQLQRAGYDCGAVDGYLGAKTMKALVNAGFTSTETDYTKLFDLPTSPVLKWRS